MSGWYQVESPIESAAINLEFYFFKHSHCRIIRPLRGRMLNWMALSKDYGAPTGRADRYGYAAGRD